MDATASTRPTTLFSGLLDPSFFLNDDNNNVDMMMLPPSSTKTNNYAGVPPPPRCLYKTGKCLQVRAMKRNKQYHRLCQYHRGKANSNQRKLDRKKKESKSPKGMHQLKRSASEDMPYDKKTFDAVLASKRPSIIAPASFTESSSSLWSVDEVEMLEKCLDTPKVMPEKELQQRFSLVTPRATTSSSHNRPPSSSVMLMRSTSLPAYEFEPFK